MITLKQYAGSIVTPKDDALLCDFIAGATGFVSGCTVTHLGANQLKIAAGWGIIQGRCFAVEEETINANVSTSGTVLGRLLIQIDTSNTETPISFVTQAETTLPDLTQENINGTGNVYQLPVATYSVSELLISGLTDARPVITAISAAKTAEWTGVTGAPDFLPKTGGTMTGRIIFSDPTGSSVKTHVIQYGVGTYLRNVVDDNNYKDISLHKDGDPQYAVNANGVLNGYKIYGEHNVTVSTAAPTSVLPDGYIHMVY